MPNVTTTPDTKMKTTFNISILAILLLAAPSPCFAMQEIMELTRAQAEKEFGIQIRTKLYNTNQLTVWLEFKPKDKLAGFMHVRLDITTAGRTLVSAVLAPDRNPEGITVSFSTDPANVPASRLTIVVREGERSMVGYEVKVKDFIRPEPSPEPSR